MAFDQEHFELRLLQAEGNKTKLLTLMSELDEEKRSIKQYLSRLSSEPREGDPKGKDRQSRIRRMKEKSGYLTKYREAVRNRIADQKSASIVMDSAVYYEAFYDAACALLPAETIKQCQSHAEKAVESGSYD